MIFLNNNVSSRVINASYEFSKNKNCDLLNIINKHSYSIETIKDTYNWINEELFLEIISFLENNFKEKNIVYEIGLYSSPYWGELSNVFKAIGNVKAIVLEFDKFYSYFFKKKTYKILDKDATSISLEIDKTNKFGYYAFNFALGAVYSTPKLWGGEDLIISKLSKDIYKISFEQNPSLFTNQKSFSNYSPRLITDIINSLEKSNHLVEEKNKELQTAYLKLKNSFNDMLISEKMATLGFLSAGIAHEINNPLSFIISNFRVLNKYFNNIINSIPSDFETYKKDIPKIFKETEEGLTRVKNLVSDINYLAHPGTSSFIPCNIEKLIESAITLTKNLHNNFIKINTIYKHDTKIECIPSSISQVLVNMLINSIQAIKETKLENPTINIKTTNDNNYLYIHIEDNGKGIDYKNELNIFEPFFTTKNPGEGTGLGLSTSLAIIKNHNGNIELLKTDKGATFKISIPLKHNKNQASLFNI